MTNKEAIRVLSQTPWLSSDEKIKLYPSINVAIEALKKQIPKKVGHRILRPTEWGSVWYCPKCEADIIKVEFIGNGAKRVSYCWCCGQKLDWSDVNDG